MTALLMLSCRRVPQHAKTRSCPRQELRHYAIQGGVSVVNRRGVNLPTVVSGRNGHSTRLSIYNNAEVPMYWVQVRICSTAFRQIFQRVGLLRLLSDCSWDERFTPHSIDSYLSRDHTDLVLKPKPQGNGVQQHVFLLIGGLVSFRSTSTVSHL